MSLLDHAIRHGLAVEFVVSANSQDARGSAALATVAPRDSVFATCRYL